jgi:Flp pilus assembly protein TadG
MGNKKRERERGAAAILVAVSLILLMGIAAVAIDLSAGFNERRQDQSASDVAAMVAVQFARPSLGSSSIQVAANNGAAEAMAVANATLVDPLAADWAACADPNRPAEFTVIASSTQCISFTENLQKARVVIPEIEVATTFGRVLGVNSIGTSAEAEAIAGLAEPGTILPFGVGASDSSASQICLKTSAHVIPPCDGPTTGDFGYLDISLYGNSQLNTPTICGNAMPNQKILANISIGVDHPLSIWSAGDPIRYDPNYCSNSGSIFNAQPNQLANKTGNAFVSNLDPGLRDGTYGHSGRLARGTNRVTVVNGTPQLDNTPLWSFIVSGAVGIPSCQSVNSGTSMASCLDDWKLAKAANSNLAPLFTEAIGDAVRFAHVPEFFVDVSNGSSQNYLIKDFRAVYLHATHWKCNANTCGIIFEPGVSSSGPTCSSGQSTSCGFQTGGNEKIEALTAFLLVDSMLPQSVQDAFPGGDGQVLYNLVK